MSRLAACAFIFLALAACSTPDARSAYSGEEAYRLACARCHDDGANGAPRIDDRDAWVGRSWLWEAVLFEHAKNGYNEMPAKGGKAALDDAAVERAVEYMLGRTLDTPASD
jgi:cytochrome c5